MKSMKRFCSGVIPLIGLVFLSGEGIAKHLDKSEVIAGSLVISGGIYSAYLHDYEGMTQLAYTFGLSIFLTEFLKRSLDKERPDGGDEGKSFPSGHTSTAFAGASYWDHRYGYRFGIPAYITASIVGLSRVNKHAHRVSEVVAGALIGYGSGWLFTTFYQPSKGNGKTKICHQLAFAPHVDFVNKEYSLQVNYQF